MTELETIKAFAKLKGVELTFKCATGLHGECEPACFVHEKIKGSNRFYEYNPIKDWSLAFKAASDYEVSTQHCTQFDCGIDGSGSYDIPYLLATTEAPYKASAVTPLGDTSTEAKARAIIECILKSKGLWRG